MHIYAFGSICRGDISVDSDIDLLAVVDGHDPRLSPDKFSVYSYERIRELWTAGNAFAWHLALESKIVYSDNQEDFLKSLGMPSKYTSAQLDCNRFREIFKSALSEVRKGSPSLVFELSTIFLAIRNIATCYSLVALPTPTFGRDSARMLGARSVPISNATYSLLMRARILSTRGVGDEISDIGTLELTKELDTCQAWVEEMCLEVERNG